MNGPMKGTVNPKGWCVATVNQFTPSAYDASDGAARRVAVTLPVRAIVLFCSVQLTAVWKVTIATQTFRAVTSSADLPFAVFCPCAGTGSALSMRSLSSRFRVCTLRHASKNLYRVGGAKPAKP